MVVYHANGLIAVDQQPVGTTPITFNPDDDRFYVHAGTDDGRRGGDVRKTFGTSHGDYEKALANARYWAKAHPE